MKIIYLLKKGLQYYPPCLTQVMTLNEIGIHVEVFHGKNSPYIDSFLDKKKIIHYTFRTDRDNITTIESAINFFLFGFEAKKIQSLLPKDCVIWIGNMETAMSLSPRLLKKERFILNVLELYDEGTIYDRWLKKNINIANTVIVCEKHRAAIMQSRYSLPEKPIIIPNKPYNIDYLDQELFADGDLSYCLDNKFVVVYQGMISQDRPLEKVAEALQVICDENIKFLVMGDCNEKYKNDLLAIYPGTIFTGYIPAPLHLNYTKHCKIGIANYDTSTLNNVFCAPNKIFEYAKYGIPMICSNNISLEESIGNKHAGLCIDFADVKEIVSAILEIKDNYLTYSANAYNFYGEFDVKKTILDIVKLYG